MSQATAIPITVSPEAAAHVRELGMQQELERMLEHTRRTVPRLRSVHVDRHDDPEYPDETRVMIGARQDGQSPIDRADWEDWMNWFIEAFPPAVGRHFGLRAYDWE